MKKRFWLLSMCILGMLVTSPSFAISGRSVRGVVVESGSNMPVPNALVVVVWRGFAGIIHGQKTCYHTETVEADSTGRFKTPAWTQPFDATDLLITNRRVTATAFKPGFTQPMNQELSNGRVIMKRFTGTSAEYFTSYIADFLMDDGCMTAHDSNPKILPIYELLISDASPKVNEERYRAYLERLVEYRNIAATYPKKDSGK